MLRLGAISGRGISALVRDFCSLRGMECRDGTLIKWPGYLTRRSLPPRLEQFPLVFWPLLSHGRCNCFSVELIVNKCTIYIIGTSNNSCDHLSNKELNYNAIKSINEWMQSSPSAPLFPLQFGCAISERRKTKDSTLNLNSPSMS